MAYFFSWPLWPLLLAIAAGEGWHADLQLHGACAAKSFLNNLLFRFMGRTASGAPWYKATTADEYLYWDPDCGSGGDGTARWILDNNAPDTQALRDLDKDGQCNYHARIDSTFSSYAPAEDFWYMECGGSSQTKVLLNLAAITTTLTTTSSTRTSTSTITSTSTVTRTTTTKTTTSKTTTTRTTTSSTRTTTTKTTTTRTSTGTSTTATSTSTRTTTSTQTSSTLTTTRTGTSTTRTTTSLTTTTITTTLMVLRLTGACPYKNFLNELTFVEEGRSAFGARWFKAAESETYMYYDLDCDGGANGKRRWIIDNSMPFPQHLEDLDQDQKCNYHARLDSSDIEGPPTVATWQMWCGLGWTNAVLHLDDDKTWVFDTGLDDSMSLRLRGLFDDCPQKSFFDGLQFDFQGHTANGAPFYKSQTLNQYIYYDDHCSGNILGSARWIIDEDRPSVTAPFDLDMDFNCSYHARVKSTVKTLPPKGTIWKIDCGGQWKDLWLALVRLPMTSTTVTQTRTVTTTTTVRTTLRPKKIVSAAPGVQPMFIVLFIIGLIQFRG